MCNNNGLCGCLNNNWWWIVILILLLCNCGGWNGCKGKYIAQTIALIEKFAAL